MSIVSRGLVWAIVVGLLLVLSVRLAPQRYQIVVSPAYTDGQVMHEEVFLKLDTQTGRSWCLAVPFRDGWKEIPN